MEQEDSSYVHLGDLEIQVMDFLWQKSEPQSVGEVQEALQAQQKLAYTTVLTVMTNLHKKGMLEREKSGKAFLYRPMRPKDEIARGMFSRIRDSLFRNDVPEFFSCFLKSQGKIEHEQLKNLKRMLEEFESEE